MKTVKLLYSVSLEDDEYDRLAHGEGLLSIVEGKASISELGYTWLMDSDSVDDDCVDVDFILGTPKKVSIRVGKSEVKLNPEQVGVLVWKLHKACRWMSGYDTDWRTENDD